MRADDDPVVLKQRVAHYRKQTAPLSDYYRQKGLLLAMDGMQAVDKVEADIERALPSAFRWEVDGWRPVS